MNVHMCAGSIRSIRDLASAALPVRDLFYFSMLESGVWLARRGMVNLSLPMGALECDRLAHAVAAFVDSCNSLIGNVRPK